MADAAEKLMTVAEFLDRDNGTDTKLKSRLKRPCYAGGEAGVGRPDRDDTFYEADIVLCCTPVEAGTDVIPNPLAIIEVLLPSTIEHDRGRKAYDYRRIESVQEIVLVSSEQRHLVIWRRRGPKWEVEDLIGDAALELESIGIAIPLAAIYADSGV